MTGRQLPYLSRVALPMFFLMIAAVGLIWVFPEIVTWLPEQMSGKS
jgi:TRAP-type C4-dicarboxylate transport system permease large subunit